MIGPIAPGTQFLSTAGFSVAPASPGVRLVAADGSTVIARTTSGIVNLGGTLRGRVFNAPTTEGFYVPEWDDSNGSPFLDETVWVSSVLSNILAQASAAAAGGGGGGGGGGTIVVSPAVGGGGGLSSSVFVIKRGDTDPPLRVQLQEPDPNDPTGRTMRPWYVPAGGVAKFTMRNVNDFTAATATGFPGAPKVHATADVDADDRSIVSYGWPTAADTDTTGTFRGELEVTASGETRTFPASRVLDQNFITIYVVDDLDPGITP